METLKRKPWRKTRWALIGLAGLITLLFLLRAEENWRGRRAWLNYKLTQEAKGERFEHARLIPPKVPDEQNFAMTPFLAPLFDFLPGTQTARDTNAIERIQNFGNEFLKRVETNTPAEKQLEMMRPLEPLMSELEVATQRPFSRFNVWYETPGFGLNVILPHLAVMKKLCQLFRYRAEAEVELGQNENALRDIRVMMHLVNSIKNENFLISQLVRIADVSLATVPVQKGLKKHVWSDENLKTLQHLLGSIDLIADGRMAMLGERDFLGNAFFGQLKTAKDKVKLLNDIRSGETEDHLFSRVFYQLLPEGWDDLEQLNYNRMFAAFMTPIQPATHQISPSGSHAASESMLAEFAGHSFLHHCLYAKMLMPSLDRFAQKVAIGQSELDLAMVACALERYRLAQGKYPDSLEVLMPRYIESLPPDVITGQSLKYKLQSDETFLLYSVGWNEKDDGGTVVVKKDLKTHPQDMEQGDWVWGKGRWSH